MFNKSYVESLKNCYVTCSSVKQKVTLLKVLKQLGYPIYEESLFTGSLKISWSNINGFVGSHSTKEGAKLIPFEDAILGIFNDEVVEVELNSEYQAKYRRGDNTIQVGCQTIQVSKLQELVAAINKLNNNE